MASVLALCVALALLSGAAVAANSSAMLPAVEADGSANFTNSVTSPTATGELGVSGSGSLDMEKLSKQEITRYLQDYPLTLPEEVMDEDPSLSAPYTTGKVSDKALQITLERLNILRRIAGLPAVKLSADWTESAQYGAVLLAVSDFSHHPQQPSDMAGDFYEKGHSATSSSNIYAGVTLTQAMDGFMDDSDASNVDRLGHRRWQLNPTMSVVGFGYAYNAAASYKQYVDERVFTPNSGGDGGAKTDYDYIAWPASGNFPSTAVNPERVDNVNSLFGPSVAWSVTLNPGKYSTPSKNSVKVTLKRESDGQTWEFSGSKSYSASDRGEYFNVETGNYGVNNCIIFRPAGITAYSGVYTVEITGIKDRKGADATLTYQVDFFDPTAIDLDLNQDMFTVDTSSETYDGSEKTKKISGSSDGLELVEGVHYTAAYKDNVNAGTASIVLTGKWPFRGETTFTFTIERAPRTISAAAVNNKTQLFVDGLSANLTLTDNASGENPVYTYESSNPTVAAVDQTGQVSPVSVGTATVTVRSEATANYASGESSVDFTVSVLPSQRLSFQTEGDVERTYGDPNFRNEAVNSSEGGSPVTYSSSTPSVAAVNETTGEVSIRGVGETVITAAAARIEELYARTEISYTLTVSPKALTITSVEVAGRVYDGTLDAVITGAAFDGVAAGESLVLGRDYTASGSFQDANAGADKPVSVEVTVLNANYTLPAGSFTASGTISRAPAFQLAGGLPLIFSAGYSRSVDISALSGWRQDMGGEPTLTVADGAYKGLETPKLQGAVLTLTADGTAVSGESATVVVNITGMVNYEDSQARVTVSFVDRTPVEITGVTVADKVYNGLAAACAGTPVVKDAASGAVVDLPQADLIYTWQAAGADGASWTDLHEAPVTVGQYRLAISVADDSDYIGSIVLPFAITPAPVTVAPRDVFITVGDDLPQAFELAYAGLVNGDTAEVLDMTGTPEFKLMDGEEALEDSQRSGVYSIVWGNAGDIAFGNGNYAVTMKNGTLTINTRFIPSVPDPSVPGPSPSESTQPWENPFRDVGESSWFYDEVEYVVKAGLMNGTGGGAFSPDSTATRAMVVTILYRLDGSPAASDSAFTDVEPGMWYADAVAWAAASGIVNGYEDGTFGPDRAMSREQLSAVLYRYAAYKGLNVSAAADLSAYTDAGEISPWALDAMRWANAEGLVNGTADTALSPGGSATRAQLAAFLMRFCQSVLGMD